MSESVLLSRNQQAFAKSTTAERFEAKYKVTELQAQAIREFIEPFVRVDKHAPPNAMYTINSLYLDSPSLSLYRGSIEGLRNRFKLRVRTYGDGPGGQAFLEVKRRVDQVIKKERATVSPAIAESILRGEALHPEALAHLHSGGVRGMFKFREAMERVAATPKVHVRYTREAYESAFEEPVRITFDRHLACLAAEPEPCLNYAARSRWIPVPHPSVVLEIKFTNQYPLWVRRLVHRFHLVRDSVAKYVLCVLALEREGIAVRGPHARGTMMWNS